MKYRIIKDWYGCKRYRVQYFICDNWQSVRAGYGTTMPIYFWTRWGARKYIKKMKRNGDEPLYIMEEE